MQRGIKPLEGAGAPQYPPDVSLRGAKRRGNLGKAVAISPVTFPRCSRELRDCTPRALPRASRSGRHVGLWPPRNDKPLVFAILMPSRTSRRCLTGRRGRRPLQRPTDSLARLFPLHLLHSSSPNIAKNAPIRSDGGVFCYIGGRGVKQVEREKPCEAVCWAL